MTADSFNFAVVECLSREPFQPFIIELHNGERFEIDRPRSLAIRGGSAGGFAKGGKIVSLVSEKVSRIYSVESPSDFTL